MKVAAIGGGQLAQMLAQSGKKLGITFRSSSSPGSCAFSDCEAFTENLDGDNLELFLKDVDVFTFESEHEGLEISSRVLDQGVKVYPSPEFVRIAGDRFLEKSKLDEMGIPVALWEKIPASISEESELANWLEEKWIASQNGTVIKTQRGGYDGKGQWVFIKGGEYSEKNLWLSYAREIFPLLNNPGCIVEDLVDFSIECSIIATRSIEGEIVTWPLTHNEHFNSILRRSVSPIDGLANLETLEQQAKNIATELLDKSNYVGTIAIECFVTDEGIIVNEIAPRVHNSGHWTIEGSKTSQFEQHMRAITGMDLGSTESTGYSVMINLVGRDVDREALSNIEGVYLHWYGKEVREARKVGHITIVAQSVSERDLLEKTVNGILGA